MLGFVTSPENIRRCFRVSSSASRLIGCSGPIISSEMEVASKRADKFLVWLPRRSCFALGRSDGEEGFLGSQSSSFLSSSSGLRLCHSPDLAPWSSKDGWTTTMSLDSSAEDSVLYDLERTTSSSRICPSKESVGPLLSDGDEFVMLAMRRFLIEEYWPQTSAGRNQFVSSSVPSR